MNRQGSETRDNKSESGVFAFRRTEGESQELEMRFFFNSVFVIFDKRKCFLT